MHRRCAVRGDRQPRGGEHQLLARIEKIEQQQRTVDKARRKALIYDIQKYLLEQMYYPPGTAGVVSTAVQPWVKNFYYISDYGQFSEVMPKVWIDK